MLTFILHIFIGATLAGILIVVALVAGHGSGWVLAGAVAAAHRRFATGVLMLWFPIKARADVDGLYARLVAAGVAKALAVELQVAEPNPQAKGLVATGVLVVNPPFTLAEDLTAVLPYLAQVLATGPGARAHWRWIVEEGAKPAVGNSGGA